MSFNLLVVICLGYATILFVVAFLAERGTGALWLRSPLVYTLSLSVYCTAWTFYGAVGYAARSGLDFATIYLGPTLIFIGWWLLLRKLMRVAKAQRITSIADLISARYGKSPVLGVVVTLICLIATTPYVALQLQSVSLSFAVFAQDPHEGLSDPQTTALWVAGGLALFTILFGTRNLDANEQHHGIVTAIALEAIVKLVALLAVGAFVVWGIAGGPWQMLARIEASPIATWQVDSGRWLGLTFLSATALLTLPRMFQVIVVENAQASHLATASWAFPLYLMLMSLFVLPIAVIGLDLLPAGANPDLFVLTLPLALGQDSLALLAFLGGFSSATSMVVIEAIALSTMLSNHIVLPLFLALAQGRDTEPGDIRRGVLLARRLSIAGVMGAGYGYYLLSGGTGALAEIGLIAFVGVSQILPALLGALFWRGATRWGALTGMVAGFGLWLYTLYLPSLGVDVALSEGLLTQGPWGIDGLRPHQLLGVSGFDPLLHALFWSLTVNGTLFCAVSLLTQGSPLERLQSARFVTTSAPPSLDWTPRGVDPEDLLLPTQRILGEDEAISYFHAAALAQGREGYLPDITPAFVADLEKRLASAIGAATAHAMLVQITGGPAVSVEELRLWADETAQIMEHSAQLEHNQAELTRTARQLRDANAKLTQLSVQKDAFLSQISHELRTPMTSIRAFSEILREGGLAPEESSRYAGIIHDETLRLTRLLDELLDLSVLRRGAVQLAIRTVNLAQLIDLAVETSGLHHSPRGFDIQRNPLGEQVDIQTDPDRLLQVLINVMTNAVKYCDAPHPVFRITLRPKGAKLQIDMIDNGSGIPRHSQSLIFERFSRLTEATQAGGAGLGLAICRDIAEALGGKITYVPGQGGAAFRLVLPKVWQGQKGGS